MKTLVLRAALALTLLAGLLSPARFASAASSTCWAERTTGFCRTDCVLSNRANHFVHVNISPFSDMYMVRDCDNGIIVYSGGSGFWGVSKTITGLYSSYTIYLYGALWPGGHATINNN